MLPIGFGPPEAYGGETMLPRTPSFLSAAFIASAFAAMLFSFAPESYAQRAGPFANLGGSWTGNGSVTLSSGANERLRCRATYRPSAGGNNLEQTLRCASDSYNFELSSSVQARGNSITGNWTETTRGVGGKLTGNSKGNQIEVLVETASFSATLTLVTNGDRQTVNVRSPGRELTSVNVTLARQ